MMRLPEPDRLESYLESFKVNIGTGSGAVSVLLESYLESFKVYIPDEKEIGKFS